MPGDRDRLPGISAVKIEGRQRSPAYVSKVAGIWRQALDRLDRDPARFHADPAWLAGLGTLSEGITTTLGESVCSRRRDMKLDDCLGIGRELAQAGKRVVLASQTLIESEADLRRLCDNGEFVVEANDQSALQGLIARGLPFVAGAALNLYNRQAIGVLDRAGLLAWQAPVEMSREALSALLEDCRAHGLDLPCEVFAHGHLPLAWSSRCFTARRHRRSKDRCGFVCQAHPEGLALRSQEDQAVFMLNGIQTLSGACQDLRHGRLPAPDPLALVDATLCDGYWHGRAGMTRHREEASS